MLAKRNFLRSFYRSPAFLLLIAFITQNRANLHSQEASAETSATSENQDGSFHRSWQFGGFAAGGFVPRYWVTFPPYVNQEQDSQLSFSLNLYLFNAGFEAGRMFTTYYGLGPFRGRGEVVFEAMPFWLADYPNQTRTVCSAPDRQACLQDPNWGPYRRFGASITPFLLRWNFMRSERSRAAPWAQLGGGLLWTNHKFPITAISTSVINFTPQVGVGESVFTRRNRSLDFAIKAVHISNAGLGDNNPGINITLQFSAGYSWWK